MWRKKVSNVSLNKCSTFARICAIDKQMTVKNKMEQKALCLYVYKRNQVELYAEAVKVS